MMGEIVYLPGAVRGGWRDTGLHFPAGLAMIDDRSAYRREAGSGCISVGTTAK